MPWMKTPVRASIKMSSLVSGGGQTFVTEGAGAGPHDSSKVPATSTAQTGVSAGATDPPAASWPYVDRRVEVTDTGVLDVVERVAVRVASSRVIVAFGADRSAHPASPTIATASATNVASRTDRRGRSTVGGPLGLFALHRDARGGLEPGCRDVADVRHERRSE